VKCAIIIIFVVLNLCSYYSFQSSYPSWEPSEQGKQFLLNLRKFKEEKLPVHGNIHAPSPPRMWRGISNMGSNIGDRNRFMYREMPYNTGNHLGSLWLIEANQNNHPSNMTHNESGMRNTQMRIVQVGLHFILPLPHRFPFSGKAQFRIKVTMNGLILWTHTIKSHWWDRSEAKQGGQNETMLEKCLS